MQYVNMTPDAIITAIETEHPEVREALARVRSAVPERKRQIAPYQGAALYALAKPYNRVGASILEIGTFIGYSAAIMAEAAPYARIVTLNPNQDEADEARRNLRPYRNVTVRGQLSWDYLLSQIGPCWDMTFVDGDHKRIARDMPYWNHLLIDGLFLHHDYSPADSARPCPPVYDELNRFSELLGRAMDVQVIDDAKIGLAGWYRRDNDRDYPELPRLGLQ